MRSRYFLLSVGLVAVLLAVLLASIAYAECNTYPNSRPRSWGNQGDMVCAYTGYGCTECYNEGGDSCATNGESCVPHLSIKH